MKEIQDSIDKAIAKKALIIMCQGEVGVAIEMAIEFEKAITLLKKQLQEKNNKIKEFEKEIESKDSLILRWEIELKRLRLVTNEVNK
jgi:hypothetical protein